jgi:predicted DNA-binding WGR domain protein
LDTASKGSEAYLMTDEVIRPVHLRRIDPTQNMRRFYVLSIQPTLFGGASLIRNWGRIGANGQSMVETFDEPVDADRALLRLERKKRRRGYGDACKT